MRFPRPTHHLLGFTGPRAEAEEIKARLARFLAEEPRLELSQDKTLITHARSRAARFLGYEITVRTRPGIAEGRRTGNANVDLRVPRAVIKEKCVPYLKRGEPACHTALTNADDYTIIGTFGARYRGIVQYYPLAWDVYSLGRLRWVMESAMLKTLAGKHHSTAAKMARKHKTIIATPHGRRVCFEARIERGGRKPLVARFGGIPLHSNRQAVINDRSIGTNRATAYSKELIQRFLSGRCELRKRTGAIEVHHIQALADLDRTGQLRPSWMEQMARQRRKTLVVCGTCHITIHQSDA